jgi:hypothetical protein
MPDGFAETNTVGVVAPPPPVFELPPQPIATTRTIDSKTNGVLPTSAITFSLRNAGAIFYQRGQSVKSLNVHNQRQRPDAIQIIHNRRFFGRREDLRMTNRKNRYSG